MKSCHFPGMPFRDQIWRIDFKDGSESAFIAVYNDEITAWSDNAPEEIKVFSGWFSSHARLLSLRGITFLFEGINE